jgi:ribosomal protein S1
VIKKSKIKNQGSKVIIKSTLSKSLREPQTMDELLAQTGGLALGLKKGTTIDGTVISVTPREVLVDIGKKSFGIIAEWELEQVKDYAATLKVGDKITAQVINPENEVGYTILSLRKTSMERRWNILSQKKEKGEDIEVVGLDTAKGGLLVEWQNLRGFIPATQLDSFLSSNPVVLIGKPIKVKILEVDQSLNRLVLSQKAATLGISPEVMKKRLDKIKQNDILKGIISGIAPFGLFVDIEGLEGLVHISEIAWEKVGSPASLYKVGDKVEVMVIDVNQEQGKLNLSLKRLTPDPWKNILDRYAPDTTISGKVVRMAPYGAFVQLDVGIEGLIHISKIPQDVELKVGQEVECLVENVDSVKRKISLTLVPKEKPVGYR